MKWRYTSEQPKRHEPVVVICENGDVFFDLYFDDDFEMWDEENGIWGPLPTRVVGWMPQKEVQNYLKNECFWEDEVCSL